MSPLLASGLIAYKTCSILGCLSVDIICEPICKNSPLLTHKLKLRQHNKWCPRGVVSTVVVWGAIR